jgi:hypothetical protein
MLRLPLLIALVLALPLAAQQSPSVTFQPTASSCGGALMAPFLRPPSGGQQYWSIQMLVRGFDYGEGTAFMLVGLAPRAFPIPAWPNIVAGCTLGVDPLVSVYLGNPTTTTLGVLPSPWSTRSTSIFTVGLPLHIQLLGPCGSNGWHQTLWCLSEAWEITYHG